MPPGIYKHKSSQGFQKGNSFGKNNKGKKFSEEQRKKLIFRKVRKWNEEQRKKVRERMMGNKLGVGINPSPETRKKIGLNSFHYGMLGKHHSEETKRKLSLSCKGEKCYLWKGGISFKPYPVNWTRTLKRSIRERDKYRCKICGEPQEDEALSVHHIDYNKLNCDPSNLITLCRSCHVKTNHNREFWIKYFYYERTKI